MPLSETAKKYAQAIYKDKAEKLSEDYEGGVDLARRYIDDGAFWQSTVGQRLVEMKAQILAGQVRAKTVGSTVDPNTLLQVVVNPADTQ
jgi:hypothetical protein